jgi:hypothetical protein
MELSSHHSRKGMTRRDADGFAAGMVHLGFKSQTFAIGFPEAPGSKRVSQLHA